MRADGVAVAPSLRSGTLPRIGELRIIAYYHAEQPRAPAAAAERRAASNNADLSVHRGGGLLLWALGGAPRTPLSASSSAWALGSDGPSPGAGHDARDTALGPLGGGP